MVDFLLPCLINRESWPPIDGLTLVPSRRIKTGWWLGHVNPRYPPATVTVCELEALAH